MIGRRRSPCWALAIALVLQHAETLSTTTLTAPKPATTAVQQLGEFNVAQLAEYEGLRGRFDRDKILGFLAKRPWTAVWKSTSASGAPDNSSLSHFSAMKLPSWLRRAARNRHRHAIEQASRRWRGGRRDRAVKF